MIVIPRTPNSVYIPVVQTGCMKIEFDSTYPVHLNGIISQNEFQESIHKINRTISSNKSLMVLGSIFLLSIIGGTILFIVGGVTQINSSRYGFPAFYAAGVALTTFGSIFIGIGCCIVQFRRVNRMREAIVEESRKYSSRSPIPCSWRLDTSTTYTGYYRNQHGQNLAYHLVIDIGRSTTAGSVAYYSNQVAPDPTTVFGHQNNYAPPPYSGQSAAFCSQCSAPRQDFTNRFCSSCGHAFNKY